MSTLYRQKILDHADEPTHYGAVEDADAEAAGENAHCGDDIAMTARFDGDTVADIKWEGEGCALSTAAASLLLEELDGRGRDAVKKMAPDEVFALLGLERDAVNPMRQKCVLLPFEVAQELMTDDA